MEGRPETAILAALSKSSEGVGIDLSKFWTVRGVWDLWRLRWHFGFRK